MHACLFWDVKLYSGINPYLKTNRAGPNDMSQSVVTHTGLQFLLLPLLGND